MEKIKVARNDVPADGPSRRVHRLFQEDAVGIRERIVTLDIKGAGGSFEMKVFDNRRSKFLGDGRVLLQVVLDTVADRPIFFA